MRERLRRLTLFSSGVADLTRNRAEQFVKDVASADLREQMADALKDVMERTEQSRKELTSIVRAELRGQIIGLGLASERDLERLERRVARLEEKVEKAGAQAPAAKTTKKTTRKATRKTTAKTTARRAEARKAREDSSGPEAAAMGISGDSTSEVSGAAGSAPTSAAGTDASSAPEADRS